jgi:hypothetical protein
LCACAQLCCFCADWAVDVQLTLRAAATADEQRAHLAAQLEPTTTLLASAVATVDGALPPHEQLVAQLGRSGTLDAPHNVSLFATAPAPLPPPAAAADASGSALVRLVGVVHGRAFASPKAEVGSALEVLKRDLTASLTARLELFFLSLDEDDEDDDEGGGGGSGALAVDEAATHALPRRAHVAVGGAPFSTCDYVAFDDEPSDVAERLSTFLSIELPARDDGDIEDLLGPEGGAHALLSVAPIAAPSARATPAKAATKAPAADAPAKSGTSPALLALLLALLVAAVAGGLALMQMGGGAPHATLEAAATPAPLEDAEQLGTLDGPAPAMPAASE